MKKIENCIKICERIENVVYTDIFYSISQINKIKNLDKSYYFDFYSKGLNKESEKRMLA
ncbi:MAG: RNA-binding protein, partial [Fusobacteriales bacterium]